MREKFSILNLAVLLFPVVCWAQNPLARTQAAKFSLNSAEQTIEIALIY
jgi:hypothetical protein